MANPRVLIIDDEPTICYSFRRVVRKQGYEVESAGTVAEGIRLFESFHPDVVILDLNLPDCTGMDAFHRIRRINGNCPVLFITAHGTTETALEAMKEGAFDYLIKPVELDHLSRLLQRAMDTARLRRIPSLLPATEDDGERIIGRSARMQEMCKLIGLLARQQVNVLIQGESGTGKELVARAIHQHSRRADKPFVAINCAALPEQLLESELFGHEQGAFTGAVRQRLGKFEQCSGGTLFLDEIGDMDLALQAKMLRVLQDQRFERLGGNQLVQTDVRILAATNHNLEELVAAGRFRADLFYRLRVATIPIPPLRERRDDVPELAHYFLFTNNPRTGLDLRGFAPETLARLQEYAWPGNVRELQSVVKEAMVRTRGHLVLPEYLPEYLCTSAAAPAAAVPDGAIDLHQLIAELQRAGETDLYQKVLSVVDRVLLAAVLRQTHNNQVKASEVLGIDRKTLRQKLRHLGLAPAAPAAAEANAHGN